MPLERRFANGLCSSERPAGTFGLACNPGWASGKKISMKKAMFSSISVLLETEGSGRGKKVKRAQGHLQSGRDPFPPTKGSQGRLSEERSARGQSRKAGQRGMRGEGSSEA